jgi:hypothetical protein
MNDRSDWLYRKDGRQMMYMCVRSLACSQEGWQFKASANKHRRDNCRSKDPSFSVEHLLNGLRGAARLPLVPCTRGGGRTRAREQPEQPAAEQPAAEQPAAEQPAAEQPAAEQPEQTASEQPAAEQPEQPASEQPEHGAPSGFYANSRSLGGQHPEGSLPLPEDAPDWRGNRFSLDHGDRRLSISSAEQPHVMPFSGHEGSDDEERYAGPLVDRCEQVSVDATSSEASGGSIDLESILETDEGHACDNLVGGMQHVGAHQEPDYVLLQSRLVKHMTAYSLPAREARRAKRTNGWAQAANKGLTNLDDAISVRDYSFDQLTMYRRDVQSRSSIEAHLRYNAYCLQQHAPDPDPAGIRNCHPPSVAAAMAVLGVPLLEWYEVHFCRTGCMHWWFYMPSVAEHYRNCSVQSGCSDCTCPHCGKCRFVRDKMGVHGAVRCWFFFDCLQTKVLDPDWSRVVLNTQARRDDPFTLGTKPIFAREPAHEYKRLTQNLPAGTEVERVRHLKTPLSMHGSPPSPCP